MTPIAKDFEGSPSSFKRWLSIDGRISTAAPPARVAHESDALREANRRIQAP